MLLLVPVRLLQKPWQTTMQVLLKTEFALYLQFLESFCRFYFFFAL